MNLSKTLFVLIFFSSTLCFGQQWTAKKYSYDSLLNVRYGTALNFNGGIDTLKMDIYTPICDDVSHVSKRPLLIWIHGGAFLAGDKNDVSITDLCKQYAKRGYVTASIDYRLGFIPDDQAWQCNYPNYSCVFASDVSEWERAYYRAVQDGKGALRYLINRNAQYRIDTENIFLAGESAGSFVALGVALLDVASERPVSTFALANAPKPHSITSSCVYNAGKTFAASVPRPDLGGIDGLIEPSTISFTIKGVGNMYGGMLTDLLKVHRPDKPKPAIYSFHQPCDLVVPIDSGTVYQGLSWCFTNGYNCYAVTSAAKFYGSRAISTWNASNNYGYTIQNEFTSTNFPYSFLLGQGSCLDQVNVPCHAYDNKTLRENNLAQFFAPLITTNPLCDPNFPVKTNEIGALSELSIYPNPVVHDLYVQSETAEDLRFELYDVMGKSHAVVSQSRGQEAILNLSNFPAGVYFLKITNARGAHRFVQIFK